MKLLKIFKLAYPEHYKVYKAAVMDVFGEETLRTLVIRYEDGNRLSKIIDDKTQRDYMYQRHVSAINMIKHHIGESQDEVPIELVLSLSHAFMVKYADNDQQPFSEAEKRSATYYIDKYEKKACEDKNTALLFMNLFCNYHKN